MSNLVTMWDSKTTRVFLCCTLLLASKMFIKDNRALTLKLPKCEIASTSLVR